jgi:hypothetical protein
LAGLSMRDAASVHCGHLADPVGGAAIVALLLHEVRAVQQLGLELVVSTAAQAQVLNRAGAAEGYGAHVVVFEHRALGTARALLAHECAALAVALGDLAAHFCGHVSRVAPGLAAPRGVGVAELLLLEALHKFSQRALQYLRDVAARLCGGEKFFRALQQVMRVLVQRDLEHEATGRERGDSRTLQSAGGYGAAALWRADWGGVHNWT